MITRTLIRAPTNSARTLVATTRTRAIHATAVAGTKSKKEPAVAAAAAPGAPADGAAAPAAGRSGGVLSSLLYGSEVAKAKEEKEVQHSKVVGRGKYVHEKITHSVLPSQREAYLAAAEAYFTTLVNDSPQLGGVKLCGSWETIIGAVGNFTHILEYEGYSGYDETRKASLKHATLQAQLKDILPLLQSRQHQIVSEFAFWPTSPPHDSGFPDGGVFELRTYELQPGKLLEWEGAWRRGLKARQRFVQPIGAFFGQIGQLHEVHHIWQYPDLETRKKTREQTWTVSTWADTVQETVKLTKSMKTTIMVPTSWSPLR